MVSVSLAAAESSYTPSVAFALVPQCTLCGGGEYHPLTPTRIFDSRPDTAINDVAPFGAKSSGPSTAAPYTFDVQIVGQPDDPIAESQPNDSIGTADVLAVLVNIIVVGPTSNGHLTAFPTGSTPVGASSIVNFTPFQVVPNLAMVRPGSDGMITINLYTASVGTAHVVIDVFGWFSTSEFDAGTPYDNTDDASSAESQADERGSRLIPIPPGRLDDTRITVGGMYGAGELRELQIRGADSIGDAPVVDIVPDDPNITGVLLNVTTVGATAPTHISLVPEDPGAPPGTSNLNPVPGPARANLVAVPVGADGKIRIYNHAGSIHIIVDVMGYFEAGTAEETRSGRVVPLSSPFRAFDTRYPAWGSVPLGPGQAETWSFADFAASVNIGGTPIGEQLGLIGNLTSAGLARQYPTVPVYSHLTVYPADVETPGTSNLNGVENAAIPNLAVLVYATASGNEQQVTVFNANGYTHYLLDVSAVILADPSTA